MIRFFCLASGNTHLDMLERVAVRSLAQSRNRAAIPHDAVFSLYTDKISEARGESILSALGRVEITRIEFGSAGECLHNALIAEIKRCVALGVPMIMAPPDTFWGDGSLGNLIASAGDARICVAATHARVETEAFLNAIPEEDIDNPALVGIAMKTLHATWRDAFADLDRTNTWWSGTSIRQISQNLWSVQHFLPTVYYAHFTEGDIHFFEAAKRFGQWDHHWPAMLVRHQRHRVIGSSDAVFMAELTEPNRNIPPLTKRWPGEADRYRGRETHHGVNRNTIFIWRANEPI